VTFAGPLYEEEQRAALGLADLFVMPSLNESFGNAAGEAVAADVPVLLTNTCGIAQLIDQRAGLAVSLGVESLAQGLKEILDLAQRDALTSQREQVKRELSWDEPIRQTEELYERILKGEVTPGVTKSRK
jgi:glycosyltransferase involved in cell wall biosynthesis